MVNLADKVIEANKEENIKDEGLDEYGLPIMDTIDYMVARIIMIDQQTIGGNLHMRSDDHIWQGNQWVAENLNNLHKLAKWGHSIPTWKQSLVWQRLREVLPILSKDKFVVADNLVWDRKEAKLEFVETKPNTTENIKRGDIL